VSYIYQLYNEGPCSVTDIITCSHKSSFFIFFCFSLPHSTVGCTGDQEEWARMDLKGGGFE